eukprot:11306474-Karenia_brevis.AAC.1
MPCTWHQVKRVAVIDMDENVLYNVMETGLLSGATYEHCQAASDPQKPLTHVWYGVDCHTRHDGRGNFSDLCTDPTCVQITGNWQWDVFSTSAPVCVHGLSDPECTHAVGRSTKRFIEGSGEANAIKLGP